MNEDQEKNQVASCHEGHTEKGHHGHLIMMILCCAIPLGIVFLAPQIGIPLKFSWLASLICPLMMIGMMIGMMVMMFIPKKEKK
ncbi:MAG TPA: hypothetical protein VHY08_12910 [Bacillota bacterium]|nr:hypothetical protein [Bacillota bacterium]